MKYTKLLVLLGLTTSFATVPSEASIMEYTFTQDGWVDAISRVPSGGKIIGSFSGNDKNQNGIIELDNNEVISYQVEFTGSIFTPDFAHTLDDLLFFEYTIGSAGFPPSFPLYSAGGGYTYDADDGSIGSPDIHFLEVTSQPAYVVPIPAALWLFGSGLLGLLGIARRKKL